MTVDPRKRKIHDAHSDMYLDGWPSRWGGVGGLVLFAVKPRGCLAFGLHPRT